MQEDNSTNFKLDDSSDVIPCTSIPCSTSVNTESKQVLLYITKLKKQRKLGWYISKLVEDDFKRRNGETPQDTVYLSERLNELSIENSSMKSTLATLSTMINNVTGELTNIKNSSAIPANVLDMIKTMSESSAGAQNFAKPQDRAAMTTTKQSTPSERKDLSAMKSFFEE